VIYSGQLRPIHPDYRAGIERSALDAEHHAGGADRDLGRVQRGQDRHAGQHGERCRGRLAAAEAGIDHGDGPQTRQRGGRRGHRRGEPDGITGVIFGREDRTIEHHDGVGVERPAVDPQGHAGGAGRDRGRIERGNGRHAGGHQTLEGRRFPAAGSDIDGSDGQDTGGRRQRIGQHGGQVRRAAGMERGGQVRAVGPDHRVGIQRPAIGA